MGDEWVRASVDPAKVVASGAGKQVCDPQQGLGFVPVGDGVTAGDQASGDEGPQGGVVVLVEGVEAFLRGGPGVRRRVV